MGAGGGAAAAGAAGTCAGVSYANRIDNPEYYNWCVVPGTSYDVVLFGGLAVVLACLLQGKLNTLMVLCAGALFMGIAWPVNLGALGNSLAIWLGISPWQLFFYVFLPPLLLDAAVRIDWYLFKKSMVQVFTLAFLVVGATCVAMVPIMLYILDLRKYGWEWIHACMFGAMIASTDAVAIVSIMKTSGGPKRLRVLLEGESLLNDASGLTLFEVFFHILHTQMEHPTEVKPASAVVGDVFLAVVQLALIGLVMGMVFGVLTRLFLRYMRYMGASHDQEVALTLGMAYLAYWVTGIPCKGSGVVAVAVMGLYGASTNCWDMSTAAHHTFDGFWETLAFAVNALVFMWSGAGVVNFFIRALAHLHAKGQSHDLETTLWLLPIIFIILTLLRFALTAVFRPLYILVKGDINMRETLFVTVAGLRGSASLIMGSAVVTQQFNKVAGTEETFSVVKAMMVFWTAGFVLLTLLINAPMLPFVLRITGLSKVPEKQLERRRRAVTALADHSRVVLDQLRDAEDELLAGVDWAQVAAFVDHGRKYAAFTGQTRPPSTPSALALRLWRSACCCCPCLPPWLTGSHAATVASHQQQLQQVLAADGKDFDAQPPGDRSHHSHHSGHHKRGHKGHRKWGARKRGHSGTEPAQQDTKQQDTKVGGAAAAAAAEARPLEAIVPQLLLSASSDAEVHSAAGRGPASTFGGAAADGGIPPADSTAGAAVLTNGQAATLSGAGAAAAAGGAAAAAGVSRKDLAARLTGNSQQHLWGSGWEDTTDAAFASSSSESDEALPGILQQQQHHRVGRHRTDSANTPRGTRTRARRRQQQLRHVSGTVSDSEDSSSEGSSDSSSSGSSRSGYSMVSRYDSNLINDVLPFLQAHEVDVLQQECPFLLSRAAQQHQHQQQLATSGSALAAAAAPSTSQQQQPGGQHTLPVRAAPQRQAAKGFAALFSMDRWRKKPLPAAAAGVDGSSRHGSAAWIELQGTNNTSRSGLPLQGSSPQAAEAPAAANVSAETAEGLGRRFSVDGRQPTLSAFAAAAASRSGSGFDPAAAGNGAWPSASRPGRGVSRSLASRSAAPALIYGSKGSTGGAAPVGGSSMGQDAAGSAALPGHRRKGSDGTSLSFAPGAMFGDDPSRQQQLQQQRALSLTTGVAAAAATPGSWGLAGEAGPARAGSPRAASVTAGSGLSATLQAGTEKALGRRSGMYGRNLGTRSTALVDSSEAFRAQSSFQPFHLPETEEAEGGPPLSRHSRSFGFGPDQVSSAAGAVKSSLSRSSSEQLRCSDQADGYDAAAVAVNMVSLERGTCGRSRSSVGAAAAAAAGSSGGMAAFPALPGPALPRAGSRGLASRSVGLVGAYVGSHNHQGARGSNGADAVSGMDPQELQQWATAKYRPSQRASPNPQDLKGLATRSTNPHLPPVAPVAPSLATISTGLAAYGRSSAAAAAASAGGDGSVAGSSGKHQPQGLPWATSGKADSSLASQSVPAAGIVAAAAAAAAVAASVKPARPKSTAGSTDATSMGGSTGNLLGMLRSSVGIGRSSGRSGKAIGRALTDDDGEYSDLSRPSDMSKLKGESATGMCDADLADARSWLVTGLKRYFHAKRMEGLLSASGLRILDSGCEVLLDAPHKPLHLWSIVSADCANTSLIRLLTYLLFGCRQAAVGLMTWGRVGRLLAWPLKVIASMLQRPLNKVLLIAVEVAMEYLMGLTTSPHVEQLQENDAWAALLAEISAEAGQVAQFLIDREIEAPERYSAVQSYRVAMAVLRQQRLFVETLFESGMLEASETSMLSHPIEAAERRLELLGPVWRAPSLMEVLRQLPFLRGQPQSVLEFIVRHGQLVMLGSGNSLPLGKVLYVVQSGIVKVTYRPDLGEVQEYFLGSGGLINLYGSVTSEQLPGVSEAVAQGNALGKGPVLFCFGAKGLRRLAAAAASGDPAFQQLELDMYRLAGLFLLERLKLQLDMEASQALARLAPLTTAPLGPGITSTAAAAAGGGGHRDKRSTRQQRAAWVRQRLGAMRAALKQQLVLAELLVLSEGAEVMQDSTVLLMKGSIQVKISEEAVLSQPGAADVARWMANAGRHQHQSILPWFWDILSPEDLQHAPAGTPLQPLPVTITAGFEGATLLVCPALHPEAVAAAAAADAQAAAAGRTLFLAPQRASGSLTSQGLSPAASGLNPAALARHSPGALACVSPMGMGPAAAGPMGIAGTLAGGAAGVAGGHRSAQNTYSRRNLAAAVAAVDSLMDPLPGLTTPAVPPAAAAAGAGAAADSPVPAAAAGRQRRSKEHQHRQQGAVPSSGQAAAPVLNRRSAGSSQGAEAEGSLGLARTKSNGSGSGAPLGTRTSSQVPLAGALIDNAASLGIDMRAGLVTALGPAAAAAGGQRGPGAAHRGSGGGTAPTLAAVTPGSGAAGGGVPAAVGEGVGHRVAFAEPSDGAAAAAEGEAAAAGGEAGGAVGPTAAAAASRRQQLRRSKSQRPLKGGGGGLGGERHVGGGGS